MLPRLSCSCRGARGSLNRVMNWLKTDWLERGLVALGLIAGYAVLPPLHSAPAAEIVPVPLSAHVAVASVSQAPGLAVPAAVPPAVAGRSSAESPELKMLREAEAQLFSPTLKAGEDPLEAIGDRACGEGSERGCLASGNDWLSALRMPDLPVRPDEEIHRYVRYFTETHHGRKIFAAWLKRSGPYRHVVADALRERQLPMDLNALVFVESGNSPTAVSSAGAAGMWQFMPSTARAYGLVVDADYDERRSVKKSAEAGAHHLSDLYDRLGSWDLALAAYNMGYQGMFSRMRELRTEDFWEMAAIEGALPRETALYVPKILSVALVLRNLDRFGFEDTPISPAEVTADIEVPPGVSFATLARAAGTSVDKLRALNPEILRKTVPGTAPMFVHVPMAGRARARVMLPRLLDPIDKDTLEQRVGASFDWGKDELPRNSLANRSPPGEDNKLRADLERSDIRTKPAAKGQKR